MVVVVVVVDDDDGGGMRVCERMCLCVSDVWFVRYL